MEGKKRQRSKAEMIQAEIAGLERSKDAVIQLGSGIRMIGDGLSEVGNAITEMLMVGIEDQLTDAREHLEMHKPKVEDLMAATDRLNQADAYLARMKEAIATIPEEYRGLFQLMMPVIEMQVQMAGENVKHLREELEMDQPLPEQVDAEFLSGEQEDERP